MFRYYCEKGTRCISNDVNNHLTDFFLGFLGGFTESLLSTRDGVLVPLEASALMSSLRVFRIFVPDRDALCVESFSADAAEERVS